MILVDTSIWVHHFRFANANLIHHLQEARVFIHDFIIGELACGDLKNREAILSLLRELPRATLAQHEEVLSWVASHRLFGKGIGWVDTHLLASARLNGLKLWTLDKKLRSMAEKLHCSYS